MARLGSMGLGSGLGLGLGLVVVYCGADRVR